MAYGASREDWQHFADTMGLAQHLLPVVCNPNAKLSPNSTMSSVGRSPSVYNSYRTVGGLPKWTRHEATPAEVKQWQREPDYGICIQCREIRAIDIDIPNAAVTKQVIAAVENVLGFKLPLRGRTGVGKGLLAFRLEHPWPKRVIPTDHGPIEWLGDGQQFVACGSREDGSRYVWRALPDEFPLLTVEQATAVWDHLCLLFANGEPTIARQRKAREDINLSLTDERASWLADSWEIYDEGDAGQLYLRCPFEDHHTTESGITATAYFPAGSGGYERGHWVCLHSHCAGREDHDFDEASGYATDWLVKLPATPDEGKPPADGEPPVEDRPWPMFTRKGGKIEATRRNLSLFMQREDLCGMWIAYDQFLDQIVWAPSDQLKGRQQWRAFQDEHYVDIVIMAESRGFAPFGMETARAVLMHTAKVHAMDSAQEWLSRQTWDGVPRVHDFLTRYMGCEDSEYATAVSCYIWTALAGRVITPGVQADMAPVFIGQQGARKTSAVRAMAPGEDTYVEVDLSVRDTDLSRKMRGKLVGELEELRGLNTREIGAIKAWITRRFEDWVPKYREFAMKFPRRLVLFGSGNEQGFLTDPTGERRFLPFIAGVAGTIDPEGIVAVRDQLWAEGAVMYRAQGVMWQDAERLAKAEHHKFKMRDAWEPLVSAWLKSERGIGLGVGGVKWGGAPFFTADALAAVGVQPQHINKMAEVRIARVLTSLGYTDLGGAWASADAQDFWS